VDELVFQVVWMIPEDPVVDGSSHLKYRLPQQGECRHHRPAWNKLLSNIGQGWKE
jgi:hypothetical protein